MRFPRSARTAPAIFAFLAALALSVPGVRVARAGEEPAAERFQRFERFVAGETARAGGHAEAGCSAGAHGSCAAPGSGSCAAPHQGLARLRRGMVAWQALVDRARRHAEAGRESGGPVALNGRGYNY